MVFNSVFRRRFIGEQIGTISFIIDASIEVNTLVGAVEVPFFFSNVVSALFVVSKNLYADSLELIFIIVG